MTRGPIGPSRIQIIRERLEEYKQHRDDPCAYFEEEIDAIRELRDNAAEDIEFLLSELDKRSAFEKQAEDFVKILRW